MTSQSSNYRLFQLVAIALTLLICLLFTSNAEKTFDAPTAYPNTNSTPAGIDAKMYDGSFALVIGDSDYTNGWLPLPGVARDVKKVRDALMKLGFQVKLLTNLKQVELDQALRQFVDEHGQDPGNRLVVYFGGHGWTINDQDGRESGYIVPSDAPSPDRGDGPFRRVAMNLMQINVYASDMRAKHALFLFDSCFSGALLDANKTGYKPPRPTEDAIDKPVRLYITAGAKDQEVPDNGFFCDQFISGLNGAADSNDDGYITGTELGNFMVQKITAHSSGRQTPRWGPIRNRLLDKGDVVFTSPRPIPTPLPTPITVSGEAAESALWNQALKNNDIENFKSFLGRYPNGRFVSKASVALANLYFDRGIKLLADEVNDEAETNVLAGLRLQRDSARGHLAIGKLLFRRRQMADASAEFKQVFASEPDNPEAHYLLGASLKEQNQLEAAAQELEVAMHLVNAALLKDPSNNYLHGWKSGILHYQKDYQGEETEGRQALALARQIDRMDSRWYERVGAALMAQERWADAEREYRAALELTPNSARWHSNLGYVMGEQHRYKEAEPELVKGVQLDPRRGQSHINLGVILAKQNNRWSDADAAFRKGMDLDPQNAGLFHHYAYELSARHKYQEAEPYYRLATEFDPRNAAQHADLGADLVNQRKYYDAEIAYREAVRLDANNSDYQGELRKIRQKLGDH
jgi:Flp pilus assembly protein TadD